LERVKCMLLSVGVLKTFHAEAITTAAYMINRSPLRTLDMNICEKIWSRYSPNIENLLIFGCVPRAHIREGKLYEHDVKCMFGYSKGVKGYRLWCLKSRFKKCIINWDTIFNETKMAHKPRVSKCELSNSRDDEMENIEVEYDKREGFDEDISLMTIDGKYLMKTKVLFHLMKKDALMCLTKTYMLLITEFLEIE